MFIDDLIFSFLNHNRGLGKTIQAIALLWTLLSIFFVLLC